MNERQEFPLLRLHTIQFISASRKIVEEAFVCECVEPIHFNFNKYLNSLVPIIDTTIPEDFESEMLVMVINNN
jgi:hypothetical protein